MSDSALNVDAKPQEKKASDSSTFSRVAKYSLVRLVMLFITVVIGVYLTILIANMGGYVDEIRKGAIREQVSVAVFADQSAEIKRMTSEEKTQLIEEQVALQEKRLGLDKPFIIRSFGFLTDALTLNLGQAELMISDSGSRTVRLILLERLPATLVLWGLANLILFFLSLFIALALSRRYGSVGDRAIIALTPTSSAPAWFYGIFLILIFAALLRVLPFGGLVDAPPPENPVLYALNVGKHLILPTTAIIISTIIT